MFQGIDQKLVWIYNPCPAVSDEEILRDSGLLELTTPGPRPPFRCDWSYGTGHERQNLSIDPGKFIPVRESEAALFMRSASNQELGLVIVGDKENAEEVRRAALKGLKAAAKFYADRGSKRIVAMQKRHNLSKAEIDEQRHEFHSYYYNAAKERAVQARISELTRTKAKAV